MSEREEIRKELRKLGDRFLDSIKEEVDSCVLLCDVDRLHGLIRQVDIYLAYRLVHDLREKGMGEELRVLCDKTDRLGKMEASEE